MLYSFLMYKTKRILKTPTSSVKPLLNPSPKPIQQAKSQNQQFRHQSFNSKLAQVQYSTDIPPLQLRKIPTMDSFELSLNGAFDNKAPKYKCPLARLKAEIQRQNKDVYK